METKLYSAAEKGDLMCLRGYIEDIKEERGELAATSVLNSKCPESDATALVIACTNGHCDVVEYLLEQNVDIEQTGSVTFEGQTIESAPPLWCAAAAGHLNIVKLLIENGANVNSTTKTNSTPLRAACYDGYFEIVKYLVLKGADMELANKHGHTCLMIACFKGHIEIAKFLLNSNVDINRKSDKGNTALHDCAESGRLEILKMLVERGASMHVDLYGMTPLLAASVTGHYYVVDYLINLPNLVSRRERVDALELLGATYVDKKRDMIGAFNLWKRALKERYKVEPELPKPKDITLIDAYNNTVEFNSLAELNEMMTDPDQLRMQALVLRERILGPAHPDTSYYIRYRGAVYADAGRFDRCLKLWNYALDIQQTRLEPLNPMSLSSLLSFTELFAYMMSEEGHLMTRGRIKIPQVELGDLLQVFYKSAWEVHWGTKLLTNAATDVREQHTASLTRVFIISLHLGCLLVKLMNDLTTQSQQLARMKTSQKHANNAYTDHMRALLSSDKNENDEHRMFIEETKDLVQQAIYYLVKQNFRTRLGRTALHLACYREATLIERYNSICQFPDPQLVRVLLQVGMDVNARDCEGNTALHLAALTHPCPSDLVNILLEYGAHLDETNSSGDTFESILYSRYKKNKIHTLVNTVKYTKLTCLAARAVKKLNIQCEGVLPKTLVSFVAKH